MLIAARQIRGCSIEGTDGGLGKVKDLLFDRESWRIRYLDVDTGGWLPGRHVILSPEVIQYADYAAQRLRTRLTPEQVENSPSLESHLPLSRKYEIETAQYFAWEAYWAHVEPAAEEPEAGIDANLFNIQAVCRYQIETADGKIGHVDDFIIDDGALDGVPWEIRYLAVDTRHWFPGRQVLVPPIWAESIDFSTRRVHMEMDRETINNSPEYDPHSPVNCQWEEVCHDYYGRPTSSREASYSA
ncbi:MAG: PRC-barrel domain-containing protein [Thermoguttaceae bacterium]|jgi:hypothetical protein|nr:PRC-barrel domain-containing protein [Thermoguttaceae bacterium]